MRVEINTGDDAMTCALSGTLSLDGGEFCIKGKSSLLRFEADNIGSCRFDEKLASPSDADLTLATARLSVPFAKVILLNGIKIDLSCPLPE